MCSQIHERDFVVLRHVGEEQCRETLADGADLENRVARDGIPMLWARVAIGNDVPSVRVHDSSDDADLVIAAAIQSIDVLSQ